MTNELEKQFFSTFGIEPHYYCADEYVFEAMLEYVCTEGNREKCKTCKKVSKAYPQITDRILLGIIAKIMWSYSCTQNDFDAYEVHTVDNLKEAVLKHAIELSKNDAYVYCGVRKLFEEG